MKVKSNESWQELLKLWVYSCGRYEVEVLLYQILLGLRGGRNDVWIQEVWMQLLFLCYISDARVNLQNWQLYLELVQAPPAVTQNGEDVIELQQKTILSLEYFSFTGTCVLELTLLCLLTSPVQSQHTVVCVVQTDHVDEATCWF